MVSTRVTRYSQQDRAEARSDVGERGVNRLDDAAVQFPRRYAGGQREVQSIYSPAPKKPKEPRERGFRFARTSFGFGDHQMACFVERQLVGQKLLERIGRPVKDLGKCGCAGDQVGPRRIAIEADAAQRANRELL